MKKIYTVLVLVILAAGILAAAKSVWAPTYPAVEVPAEWGRVIGYTSTGEPRYGHDRTTILFEADDGTLRRLKFKGGEPELSHVIRRVHGNSR